MKKSIRTVGVSALSCLCLLTVGGRAEALNIALEAAPNSCIIGPMEVYARLSTLLTARGHTVSVVSGTQLDTLNEISAYNVVAFGGANFQCPWDWSTFDATLPAYVQQAGGGVVVTGWGLYYMANNTKMETYPGLETVLPMVKGTQYFTNGTIDPIAGHPITQTITSFPGVDYNNYGAGIRPGATPLIQQNNVVSGAAWTLGAGRSVYLGPIYLADWGNYLNEPLFDGSQPQAQALLIRAIEWAGAGMILVDTDNDGFVDTADNCPTIANSTQLDTDNGMRGDVCDNCVMTPNTNQMDGDGDTRCVRQLSHGRQSITSRQRYGWIGRRLRQ